MKRRNTTNRKPLSPTRLVNTGHKVTMWQHRDFARSWYMDAQREVFESNELDSKRKEIIFAMCFVESYFYEWVKSSSSCRGG